MINVEVTMTMAVVGLGFFIVQCFMKLIKMNAMTDIISFIVVGVMTLVERPVSASTMISHRMRPLGRAELGLRVMGGFDSLPLHHIHCRYIDQKTFTYICLTHHYPKKEPNTCYPKDELTCTPKS